MIENYAIVEGKLIKWILFCQIHNVRNVWEIQSTETNPNFEKHNKRYVP